MMAMMAVVIAGLRAEITARGAGASIPAVVAITIGGSHGTFPPRAVLARASVAVAVRFTVVVPVHLWSTVAVLVPVTFGAEIGSTAVTVGAAIAVTFRTWNVAARASIGSSRRTLIALAFAGFTALGAPRLAFAGAAEFIDADLAVAVAIELPEQVGGAIHFLVIDDAVVIGIERAKESGHGALRAVAAFGMRCAFARSSVRRTGWRSAFLSGQRPRGQRESEGGDKEMSGFHGDGSWGESRFRRLMFHPINATTADCCASAEIFPSREAQNSTPTVSVSHWTATSTLLSLYSPASRREVPTCSVFGNAYW